jgi:hypothetical protein
MKNCKYCKKNASWRHGDEFYCKFHAPDGSKYRILCSVVGCILPPSRRSDGVRYCRLHAPANSIWTFQCCVEGCTKMRKPTAIGGAYCRQHGNQFCDAEFDSLPYKEIRKRCGKFIRCNGYVFSRSTYDIVVQQTAQEYTPLPWNRPTTVILYNTCSVDVLCAAINAEREQFTGGIIRLP